MLSSDSLAWIAVLLFIVGIVAAIWWSTTAGWVLIAAGIGLIIYAKLRS